MRVSDAQCLAAMDAAAADNIKLLHVSGCYSVVDNSKPANERVIWSGNDLEYAGTVYKIEYMRPVLTAALNVS